MDLERLILDKLDKNNIPYLSSGNGWLLSSCLNPQHDDKKPSFSINLNTGSGHCFGCGYSVNTEYWTSGKVSDEDVEEFEREHKYKELIKTGYRKNDELIESFLPPFGKPVEENWRGLRKDTIDDFGLYVCTVGKFKNRVIFPMQNQHFDARTLGDSKAKYMHSFGFKPKLILYPYGIKTFTRNYVVVVEGIIDCVSLWQSGVQAVCNFGVANNIASKTNIAVLMRLGIDTVYLMFDEDEAGHKATEEFMKSELLDYFEVKHAKAFQGLDKYYASGCKDYNEFVTKSS